MSATTTNKTAVEQAVAEQAVAEQAVAEQAPKTIKCKNVSKTMISTSKGNVEPGKEAEIPFGEWTALVTCGLEPI